ncbi:unnamed protein product [Notodromas monacha]|uniref:Uncharacterized protein n=1 Tax=Notodromas monacha TaxID=399045 RepID=A0A7R9GG80_9CRUS|nr:unnamed protein product [Notodromas monacha]CAG0919927.1 unnamed protein product [Notodromas monacha]
MASCLRCMFQLTIPGLIFYAGVLAAQRSVVPPGVPTPAEIYKDVTGEEMPTVSPTEVWEAASGTASSDENASETNKSISHGSIGSQTKELNCAAIRMQVLNKNSSSSSEEFLLIAQFINWLLIQYNRLNNPWPLAVVAVAAGDCLPHLAAAVALAAVEAELSDPQIAPTSGAQQDCTLAMLDD